MMQITRRFFAALALGAMALLSAPAFAQEGTPHFILTLEGGEVDIELMSELAPKHVERIVTLTNEGFYNGVAFHRVLDGFMAQAGDPSGTGGGGSTYPNLPAEFSKDVSFQRGVLGMARKEDPNSANSQFFIMYADAPHLNGKYTIFGKVVSGMEFVDALKKGPPPGGVVVDPDHIVSARIEYR